MVASVLTADSAHADASTGSGGEFVPVQGRILDTRSGSSVGGYSTPMPAGTWRAVQVTGQAGIPSSGVAAVAVNFTAFNPSADGYLKADKDEATPNSTVSYLHWQAGVTQSNSGVVAVGDDGKIQVEATSSTDLAIDVQGYYTAGDPAAGGFVPVTQSRLVDTRNGTGLPQAKLTSGSTTTIQVAGLAGVPSDASAVMFDFLVLNQTASGHLVPYPADETRPLDTLQFGMAGNDATSAAVGLSSTGSPLGAINVYTLNGSGGTIDLVVDVLGYFTATGSGGAFTPGAARVYDSRWSGNTPLAGGTSRTIPIAGQAGVPAAGISAVAINIVVFDDTGTANGYLRAWPSGTTESIADLAVQYPADGSASNMLTLALGSDGAIQVHNMTSADTIDIAVFVEGWYSNALPLFTPVETSLVNSTTGNGLSSALPANTWETIDVVDDAGLPLSGVGSVALTFTVINPRGSGHLEAVADDASPSGLDLLDFAAGQRISGSAVVALSSAGKIKVMVSASTDLAIDLQGYYFAGTASAGGYIPLTPTVVGSTTDGTGGMPASLTSVSTTDFAVTGTGSVPTDATSVVLLLSENDSTTSSGTLSVYPAGGSIPASTLSWPGGQPIAWTVAVGVNSTGRVAITMKSGGPISLTVTLEGYYAGSSGIADNRTFTAQQWRVADTTQADQGGPLLDGETRSIQIAGEQGIPALDEINIRIAILDVNATASSGSSAGVVNVSAGDTTLNSLPVRVKPTGASASVLYVPVGPNGDINITNVSGASVDTSVDVEGWFSAAQPYVATPPTTAVVGTTSSDTTTSGSDSTATQPSETDAQLAEDLQGSSPAFAGVTSAVTVTNADGTTTTTDGATSADSSWTDVSASDGSSTNDLSAPADPNFDSSQVPADEDLVATSDVAKTTDTFAGTPDTGTTPADPTVARINNRIAETVNSVLKVYNATTHAIVYQRSLKKLFGVSTDPYDPHVIVVPSRKRFAVVAAVNSKLLVLYTRDSYFDTWCHVGFPQQASNSNFIDFPLIGASEKYLYFTSNLLHKNADGTTSFVTNATTLTSMSELQQCSGTSHYRNTYGLKDPATGVLSRTLAPSVNYTSYSGPYVYLVSKYQGDGSHLVVHYILDRDPTTVYATTAKVRNYYRPHDASEPGIQSKIVANGGEPFQVTIGKFGAYTAMTTWDPTDNVDATRLTDFDIDFSSNHLSIDVQRNIVFDHGFSALYPSAASNANGDTVVSSVLFGPNGYERIAVVTYDINFRLVSTLYPQIASASYAAGGCTSSSCPASRWGDFSSVAPTGSGNFILVQQTVRSALHWGTRIVEVHVS